MSDAPESTLTTETETFSAEYVNKLKAELEAQSKAASVLKAKFASHEARQREKLAELQPTVIQWVEEGIAEAGEHKHDLAPLSEFAKNLHQAENIESAMPLARMISCHSERFKRTREEFAQVSAASEQLGKANKALEEMTADRDAKATRVEELTKLCDERQAACERLQDELAKSGVLKEKFDFSNASAREKAPAEAAAPAEPFQDPLLAYVQGAGSSGGRLCAAPNYLGGSSAESSLHAALRVA